MTIERIGNCILYHDDCREVLPWLDRPDCIITDPPYGTGEHMHAGGDGKYTMADDQVEWDVHDPLIVEHLPGMADQVIIWGGNHYRLPPARGWLVWNKIIRNFSTSVCELAWTNLNSPIDAFDYSHGQLALEGKVHPTQKPLPLMMWCALKTTGTVVDPYMGSGTTGVACAKLGRPFIGIERNQRHFESACRRIEAEFKQGDLLRPFTIQPTQRAAPQLSIFDGGRI